MAESLARIVLWLFVINLGIAFGARLTGVGREGCAVGEPELRAARAHASRMARIAAGVLAPVAVRIGGYGLCAPL